MNQAVPRVGVIGAGYWGQNLIRNTHELGALVAVCDPSDAALDHVRETYPDVSALHDYATMLKGPIDAVIIAAPAALHATLALQAIDAGKAVFIEKPLALRVEDGVRVAAAAQERGVISFVGHVLLYHPAVQTMLDELRRGRIGNIWHVRSRRLNLGRVRTEENVWWSFAPHDVALVLAIFEQPPLRARTSHIHHLSRERCDFAYVDYDFPGERSAHIEVSWLDPVKSQRLDVFGNLGVLSFEDSREGARLRYTPYGVRQGEKGPVTWREDHIDIAVPSGEPLRRELEAFFESIRTGVPAPTDAEEGVAVVRALAMAESAALATPPLEVPA